MSRPAKLATAAIILTAICCYSQADAATHPPVGHTTVHHPTAKKTHK